MNTQVSHEEVDILKTAFWHSLFIVIASLVLIVISLFIIDSYNQAKIKTQLNLSANNLIEKIEKSLAYYEYGLRGLRGALVSHQDEVFDKKDFHKYLESRDLATEFPGARGVGILKRLESNQVDKFVSEMRKSDWPNFELKELSKNTGERVIIQYIEPLDKNKEAVGLDIASEYNRKTAAINSMRSGKATLTGPITLVQATKQGKQSFLFMLPIYEGIQHLDNEMDRIKKCIAWAYSPLLMDEILGGVISKEQIRLQLSDVTEKTISFYDSNNSLDNSSALPSTVIKKTLYGRIWQLKFTASPNFIKENKPIHLATAVSVEAIIAGLLTFLSGLISYNLQRKRLFQLQKNRLATIVESSNDAILSKDLHGVVQSWNPGAEKLFGYSAVEAIGHSLLDLIIPKSRESEEYAILDSIKQGKSIENLYTVRHDKSGNLIDVSIMVSPVYDEKGTIIGASKTIRDVTEVMQLQNQLKDLNNQLEKKASLAETNLERVNRLLNDVLDASVQVAIMATDMDGLIMLFNTGAEDMLGYSAKEVIGEKNLTDIISTDYLDKLTVDFLTTVGRSANGFEVLSNIPAIRGYETIEAEYVRKTGEQFFVSQSISPIRNIDKEITGYVSIAINIHDRKMIEIQRERELIERETLLREVYHRVKNNLQVVGSLFNMQIRSTSSSEARDALTEAQQRVKSMALVHEKLYQSSSLSSISLSSYMRDLIGYIANMASNKSNSLIPKIDIEDVSISIDKAVPLGLVINELLTNALKYAVKDNKELLISIKAWITDSLLTIEFNDNGKGFEKLPEKNETESLGYRLIYSLVRQLNGEITIENRQGAFVRLIIPNNK